MNAKPDNDAAAGGQERILKTVEIRVERKVFTFQLKENRRGRFLQITETDGSRSKIIIPASGLQEFTWLLEAMIKPDLPPETSAAK